MLTVHTRFNILTGQYQATVVEPRALRTVVHGDAGEHGTREEALAAGRRLAAGLRSLEDQTRASVEAH